MRRPAKILGLITIGQSPRPDLAAEFEEKAGAHRVRLVGALDTCSTGDMEELTREPPTYPLITRLRSGATVVVDLKKLVPFVVERAEELTGAGAAAIVLLCTGDFPPFETSIPLLLPRDVMRTVATGLAAQRHLHHGSAGQRGERPTEKHPTGKHPTGKHPTGKRPTDRPRIGVVAPVAAQMPNAEAKWKEDGFDPVVTTASPYIRADAADVARVFQHADVSLIVLDCLGYDRGFLEAFENQLRRTAPRHVHTPVILPQRALAEAASRHIT